MALRIASTPGGYGGLVTAHEEPPVIEMPEARSLQPIRFGLVGTGYWASAVHAPAVASSPGTALTAVWGRNAAAANALAAEFGATGHGDFTEFLADVDAIAFAVPPGVQAELAVQAARAGKHLLLEKPIALTAAAADALADAVAAAGVASVVFFTSRFEPDTRSWLDWVIRTGDWAGGSAIWLGSAFSGDSPFDTPWRRDFGGLWDLGPHAVSLLWAILGPVRHVTADRGRGDLSHLVLHHEGGPTSTASLTLGAPPAAAGFRLEVWGEHGIATLPGFGDPIVALRVALAELAVNARSGDTSHPCDAAFGRDVTRVLATAERHLAGRLGDGGYAR
jgi:predicted dehydrogenase